MKFWIVDQIGSTYAFADKRAAKRYAKAARAGGAEDLTIGTIDGSDLDVLMAVAEVACRKGATLVKRLSETPPEYR